MPEKTPEHIIAAALEFYKTGISAKEAGAKVGISEARVLNEVNRLGLPNNSTTISSDEAMQIVNLFKDGKTVAEIAKITGRCKPACRNILLKKGLVYFKKRLTIKDRKSFTNSWCCIKCKENLPLFEFDLNSSKCRPCTKSDDKQYLQLPSTKKLCKKNVRKHKQKILDRIIELKTNPCTDCGIRLPHFCMEYDHLRDKTMSIAQMLARHMPIHKIEQEIAKCELVCARCHRIRTFSRPAIRRRTTKSKVGLTQQSNRIKFSSFLLNIKESTPCLDCGFKGHGRAMDFDHRDDTKKLYSISKMACFSEAKIQEEIAKCDIVCVNCHKIRTWTRKQYMPKKYRTPNCTI